MPEIPFADFGLKWFEDIVGKVTEWFTAELTSGYRTLGADFFGTPLPDGRGGSLVVGAPAPADEPWHSIYDAVVAGEVMMFSLVVLFLAIQGRHFVRIFNVSSSYEVRRAKRGAWTGGLLIVTWYWLAVLMLYLVEGLTVALIPDMSSLTGSLLELLPASISNPALALVMAVVGGLSMVALRAIFFVREILVYVYLLGMPIGFSVAFANLPVLSRIAKQLCKQFIPLAFLPLPTAVLYWGYALLFGGEQFLELPTPFLSYFVVISLPLLSLYLTWKTFRYASPLTAKAIGTASTAAVTIGTVAGAGYVGGGTAAAATARRGVRGAATRTAARGAVGNAQRSRQASPRTRNDAVAAPTSSGPGYRRRENDPARP